MALSVKINGHTHSMILRCTGLQIIWKGCGRLIGKSHPVVQCDDVRNETWRVA